MFGGGVLWFFGLGAACWSAGALLRVCCVLTRSRRTHTRLRTPNHPQHRPTHNHARAQPRATLTLLGPVHVVRERARGAPLARKHERQVVEDRDPGERVEHERGELQQAHEAARPERRRGVVLAQQRGRPHGQRDRREHKAGEHVEDRHVRRVALRFGFGCCRVRRVFLCVGVRFFVRARAKQKARRRRRPARARKKTSTPCPRR